MSDAPPNLGVIITGTTPRKVIYGTYIIIGVLLGGAQVAFSSLGIHQPDWLTAAFAVDVYLSLPIGGLALANATAKTPTIPGNPT